MRSLLRQGPRPIFRQHQPNFLDSATERWARALNVLKKHQTVGGAIIIFLKSPNHRLLPALATIL